MKQNLPWHQEQDVQVTTSLDAIEEALNHPSAVRRLWATADSFIGDKHVLNVMTVRRSQDRFRVLDVGCGSGELLERLARHFPNAEFVGIEPNAASIALAQRRRIPRCEFLSGGFDSAHKFGQFDIVICSKVFEHVLDTDALLDVLAEVLCCGGYLSISTPSGWMYRTPGLYNAYKILTSPKRFWRLYLRPEHHWAEALAIHPAIQPAKLRRLLESRGLFVVGRQSCLWWFLDRGIVYRSARIFENRIGGVSAALAFYHLITLLEGLMNVFPPFRCFESRFVLLGRKRL